MKIAVVLDTDLDHPDGVQQCVLTVTEWLTKQGHEIHYVVGETTRTDLTNLHVAARNVSVKFNGNRLTIPLPTAQKKLNLLLSEIKPDIVHIHAPYSPFMGAKAIKATAPGTGIVGTFHVLPYGTAARYGTKALGFWLRPSLSQIHAMYAGTAAAAEFASWSMFPGTQVLPHAVAISHFKAAKSKRPKSKQVQIVFLGRLVQRKGALQLVQAVSGLSPATRELIMVRIGGRGEQLAAIQSVISENKLENCIQLDGFISEADKPAYLAAADIAIFPSISGESFGISLIEPMAAGAGIVVGGNNPGYQAILGDWPETLFDPTNIDGFTDYLEKLISDKPLRTRIHGLQQIAVDQYDIERIGVRWLEIYAAASNTASGDTKISD